MNQKSKLYLGILVLLILFSCKNNKYENAWHKLDTTQEVFIIADTPAYYTKGTLIPDSSNQKISAIYIHPTLKRKHLKKISNDTLYSFGSDYILTYRDTSTGKLKDDTLYNATVCFGWPRYGDNEDTGYPKIRILIHKTVKGH